MEESKEDFATLSVLSYMEKEGKERVNEYLNSNPKDRVGFPNYSDMIKTLSLIGGTTRDGIKFESTRVHRSDVTTYLKARYNERW